LTLAAAAAAAAVVITGGVGGILIDVVARAHVGDNGGVNNFSLWINALPVILNPLNAH